MEYKHFDSVLEVKSDESGDGRTIVGYASTYGNRDRGGDIVQKGAFAKSLEGGKLPKMLFGHDPMQPIGKWDSYIDDETGLILTGRLADTVKGNEIASLIKMGAIDSLSIGFAIKDYALTDSGTTRILKEVDLWETSIVVFPMNISAEITAIKAASDAEIERKQANERGNAEALDLLTKHIASFSK